MSQLTRSAAWKALAEHRKKMGETSIRALFEADPKRFDKFVRKLPDALFDFSQHRITEETLRLLVDLAKQADVAGFIERMFSADKINFTERRAVLHIALRNRGDRAIEVDGEDVMPGVRRVLDKMRKLSDAVRSGEHKGYTGKPITDIVNIGIGGSDLGPVMATEALKPYWQDILRAYFVSNIDGTDLVETLEGLSPETTLFCVASKTFRPGRHLEHQQLRSMGRGARQAARHGHPARAGRNRLGRHARKLDQRSDQLHKQTRGKEMR